MHKNKLILLLIFLSANIIVLAQPVPPSLSFEIKTSPNIDFSFNTIKDYQIGITKFNVITLNINAIGTEWDLYTQATTMIPNVWDQTGVYYGSSGILPPVNILQLNFKNANNTSQQVGYFPISNSPTYIIGTAVSDPTVNCAANQPSNVPGTYLTSPACNKFNVDFRVIPGLTPPNICRPGIYTIRVDFIVVEDL
ncbi:MAG: hypothetical protein A2X12_02615 [Bacteroidetes bacterium GWE2_29_8]|nr:MAG: hypothetical protein A2X12_02615 [Bacteroidetes bacterium GWE2_29_8]OFY22214.1 MAG: hypothetical protein A2X02_00105 [Bacteroidetes bacterium GWF2_29_10]